MTSERGQSVVLNALALRPGGSGVQTYERELLRALPDATGARLRAVVQADAVSELPDSVDPVVRRPSSGVRRALQGLRGDGQCDVFHGLDVDLPARPHGATVATVHDLSVFDIPRVFSALRIAGERALVRSAVKRADVLIAVSSFTAERLKARFGRDSVVIGEAPSDDFRPATDTEIQTVRETYRLPAQFVLHVGAIDPRKNLDMLGDVCAELDIPLVLAGSPSKGASTPRTAISAGYVDRESLPALYCAATVVAYCPVYEGFGLPVVEAMACGAPVVASRIPPIVDSVGDAAETVAPDDVAGWSTALGQLINDRPKRDELASRGRARVADLSWRTVAESTVSVYRSLGVVD